MEQLGASEVFLDGGLVTRFGTVSARREEERAFRPRRFVGLRTVATASVTAIALVRNLSAGTAFFVGVFAAFTVLYLLLWAFRRRSWENLFFALFTGFVAGNFCVELRFDLTEDASQLLWLLGLLAVTSVGIVLSGIALEHVVFRRRPSWWTWLIGALGAVLLAWLFTWTSFRPIAVFRVYLLLGAAEMLRVAVAAVRRRERDAWIVAGGLGTLTLAVLLSQAALLLGVRAPVAAVFVAGLFVLVLSLSVYLSRRIARTQRELEERLAEVQTLTARTVEQERRAAALFSSLASRDATGIVDGMLAGAVSFLGGAGLEDDFTVLALKVR